ncbi:hypothetical protein MWU50_14620 [Flavobacteriaceae bacterium S0862]|nr:hypothetical protein [Flavobacteriaceae bacterium S0862]
MKKLVLVMAISVLSFTSMNSQTFKLGGSLGLPAADASDISTFVLGVDAYYYFTNIDAVVEFGVTAGFRNFFGDEIEILGQTVEIDDGQFLPLAGAARLKLFGILTGGADLGYAMGINDGNDGGLYIRPVVGIDIADTIELNTSYESITNDGVTWGSINLGILFEF